MSDKVIEYARTKELGSSKSQGITCRDMEIEDYVQKE